MCFRPQASTLVIVAQKLYMKTGGLSHAHNRMVFLVRVFHLLHHVSLYRVFIHFPERAHRVGDHRDLLSLPLADWRSVAGQTTLSDCGRSDTAHAVTDSA